VLAEVMQMRQQDALGKQGEQLAAEYLERVGFRILDRNYRCSAGEIDIVAADRRMLVACEVKTRSDVRYGTPVEAVTNEKLRRLRHLAVRWVLAHPLTFDGLRVDIVGVLRSASGDFTIEHVRGVG
jgi:putative endonuclease